nr:uncharacterized protein LOC119163039 isoform X3 [Rhipicephalus microplus]
MKFVFGVAVLVTIVALTAATKGKHGKGKTNVVVVDAYPERRPVYDYPAPRPSYAYQPTYAEYVEVPVKIKSKKHKKAKKQKVTIVQARPVYENYGYGSSYNNYDDYVVVPKVKKSDQTRRKDLPPISGASVLRRAEEGATNQPSHQSRKPNTEKSERSLPSASGSPRVQRPYTESASLPTRSLSSIYTASKTLRSTSACLLPFTQASLSSSTTVRTLNQSRGPKLLPRLLRRFPSVCDHIAKTIKFFSELQSHISVT